MLKQLIAILALTLAIALPAFAATPVNINTADAQTIAASLDGVGLAKAQAIVDYRKAHGNFKHADDLQQVKGIGAATLTRNAGAIRMHGGSRAVKTPAATKTTRHARKATKAARATAKAKKHTHRSRKA